MRIAPAALTAALAASLALSLVACSSTSNGTPSSAPPTAPGSSAPAPSSSAPTAFPSTPVSTSASGALSEAQAHAALLTGAEIGNGFQQVSASTTDSPLPCTPNEPPLDKQFPPQWKVKAEFGGLNGKAELSEEIENYTDTSTVAKVFTAGEQGLGCGTTTVSGVKFTLQGPTDLSQQLGTPVDKAEGWAAASAQANAVLVVVQLGTHLVVFSFAADPTVTNDKLPNTQDIIGTALKKVASALK